MIIDSYGGFVFSGHVMSKVDNLGMLVVDLILWCLSSLYGCVCMLKDMP